MRNYLTLLLLFVFSLTANAQVIWKDGNYASFLPKKGFYLFDGKFYSSLTVDPTAGAGVVAGIGSLGVRDNAGAGEIWLKSAAANTAWNSVLTTGTGWALLGNAGTTPGTNFIGTTDAQDFQVHTNGITQLVFDKDGGFYAGQFPTPVDGVGENRYQFSSVAIPTVPTTTSTLYNMTSDLGYDSGLTGFGSGTLATNRSLLSLYGTGTVAFAGINANQASFSPVAGTTTLFKGTDTNTGVGDGYTVTDLYNTTSYVNMGVASTTSNIRAFDGGLTFLDSVVGTANGLSTQLTAQGSTTFSSSMTGYSSSLLTQNASVMDQIIGVNNVINTQGTTTTTGVTGEFVNVATQGSTVNSNGLQAISFNVTGMNASSNSYITGLQANVMLQDTAASVGGVSIMNVGATLKDTASAANVVGINVNPSVEDSFTTANVNVVAVSGDVTDTSTVANVGGLSVNTQISGSAAVTNFSPFSVTPQVLGTAVVTNGVTVGNFTLNTTPTIPSVVGLNVDVQNANVTDPFSKTAITTQGGQFSANYGFTLPPATTFFQTHYIGGSQTVALGSPVPALFGFGTNMAQTLDIHDNIGPDGSGLRLGYVNVGFVGAIQMDAGTTMDSWTGALGGFGVPAGAGGIIDQAIMFRAAGGLPQGGAATANDIIGFNGMTTLCGIANNNCWGVRIDDPLAKNLFVGTVETDDALIFQDPGVGTFTTTIQAATLAADWTLTLPVDDGAANQALITDGAGVTSWSTVAISPLTTKGDIWVYSTLDTRLPVGANGEVLTADSGAAEGVSWQALPGVGTPTVETQVADFTVTKDVSLVDASGGPVVVTLPSAAVIRYVHIKKIDLSANAVTLAAAGGDTVEDDLTLTITDGKVSITLVSDGGTAWHVL